MEVLMIGMAVILGICSIMDLLYQKIWMPLIVVSLIYCFFCLCFMKMDLLMHVISGISAGGIFFFFYLMMKGQIGAADSLLIGISVLSLGYIKGMAFVFLGFLYAFLAAVILVVVFRKKRDTRMPFAPFLFASYLTVFFMG